MYLKLFRRRVELIRNELCKGVYGFFLVGEDLENERGGNKQCCLLPYVPDFPSHKAVVLLHHAEENPI